MSVETIALDRYPSDFEVGLPEPEPYRIIVDGGGSGVEAQVRGVRRALDEAAEAGDVRAVNAELTALVSVADDGGSTGRLMREEGMHLPPGDMRRALSALSPEPVAELMEFRFGENDDTTAIDAVGRRLLNAIIASGNLSGYAEAERMVMGAVMIGRRSTDLEGHAFGNFMLAAAYRDRDEDLAAASLAVGAAIGARGRVLPVSPVSQRLVVRTPDGKSYNGEHYIDVAGEQGLIPPGSEFGITTNMEAGPNDEVFMYEKIPAHELAVKAVREADVALMGLGSWYTSNMPARLILEDAFAESDARRVVVHNLSEQNVDAGMSAEDRTEIIRRYVQRVDLSVVNQDTTRVRSHGLTPVAYDVDAMSLMPAEHGVAPHKADSFIRVRTVNLAESRRAMDPNDALAEQRSTLVTRGYEIGKIALQVARVASRESLPL